MSEYRVIEGDCIAGMRTLPAGSVHTCISSPPYWWQRDYGADGQIGLEETPEAYVARMVEVYREVWRVLRDDGTCWVNLGDSYSGGGRGGNPGDSEHVKQATNAGSLSVRSVKRSPLKDKDLVGIPWMVAFALRADGWYLRSDIIWSKPNPMPESVTDRPTKAHEYIFLLTKQPRYYFDHIAIQEPLAEASIGRLSQDIDAQAGSTRAHAGGKTNGTMKAVGRMPPIGGVKHAGSNGNPTYTGEQRDWPSGRNKRTVWHIPTQSFAEAHFATYPEKLVEPMVLAGTSERGCCPECGAPWRRVTAKDRRPTRPGVNTKVTARGGTMADGTSGEHSSDGRAQFRSSAEVGNRDPQRHTTETRTVGWEPTCQHGREPVPCTVLDPFTGSGTTGVVACGYGRDFIGTELNAEYAAMARRRIGAVNPLLVREAS